MRRITDLFLRMHTKGAEVAATVAYAARELNEKAGEPVPEVAVFEAVKEWKQRRRPPIEDEEFASTIRSLNMLGWVQLLPSKDLPIPAEQF